jgi:hypothetical protein
VAGVLVTRQSNERPKTEMLSRGNSRRIRREQANPVEPPLGSSIARSSSTMSFALHPNKVRLPPLYAMFTDDDLAPTPGTRSHAKKKPASYIPRPKNAFIIFRTLYSKWNATLPRVADPNRPDEPVAISDHRALSKYAGEAWRCMTEDEKAPYKDLADEDKAQHRINYPDYKYSPGERAPSKKTAKKGKPDQRSESPPSSVTSESVDHSIVDEIVTLYQPPRRRSSSCPPTASQSWNIALPQPFTFQQDEAAPAPVFTNPWSNSLCSPDDAFNQIPDQRFADPATSWRRGSKDDFAVSYGQSRSVTPNPLLCNSMGEFTRRVSKYDTSFNSYTPSSLSTAILPPREHTWLEMSTREVPSEFSSNTRWDRKKSRDDFDMHLPGSNGLASRTRGSQVVRKASIDDFGINYGPSSRLYGWNQASLLFHQ